MIEQFLPYLVMVSIVFGGICAVVTTRNITRSAPISNKIKRQYDLYISDLESSNKRLNGKLNQMKKSISISPEEDFISNYVQQNPDAIKSIVEKFTSKQPGKSSATTTTENESTL